MILIQKKKKLNFLIASLIKKRIKHQILVVAKVTLRLAGDKNHILQDITVLVYLIDPVVKPADIVSIPIAEKLDHLGLCLHENFHVSLDKGEKY